MSAHGGSVTLPCALCAATEPPRTGSSRAERGHVQTAYSQLAEAGGRRTAACRPPPWTWPAAAGELSRRWKALVCPPARSSSAGSSCTRAAPSSRPEGWAVGRGGVWVVNVHCVPGTRSALPTTDTNNCWVILKRKESRKLFFFKMCCDSSERLTHLIRI